MPLTTDPKLLALSHDVIEGFDKANGGVHAGFRPAHAKGILLTGTFTPSADAASLTRAPHIQRSSTPVTVRFSDFAGIPAVPDNGITRARAVLVSVSIWRSTRIPTSSLIQSTLSPRVPPKASWNS